jgi:hypothetical protein
VIALTNVECSLRLGVEFVDSGRGGRECGLRHQMSIFFTIVAFLVWWVLSLATIRTLEGKATTLATMEANFGSLFAGGWSYIRDQCRREMYMWIGAHVEIVTPLRAIVVFPIWWGLCGTLSSL